MNILGIETSCDETSVAVVRNGSQVLSNVVASSIKDHQKYGGIIPEIASRRQIELISLVAGRALEQSQLKLKDMDAVSVTHAPGLIGSLLVGISFARSLGFALKKPVIEVDHIKAHLYANFLFKGAKPALLPTLPAIGLVVSGGHTSLFEIKRFDQMKLLGQTRDDAAGEAFDKVARILDLGYPGGPVIDRLARKVGSTSLTFPCASLPGNHDFSFSGVKTAVLYYVQKHRASSNFSVEETVFAFQESVVKALVDKAVEVCKKRKAKTLLIGGGVAANSALRTRLTEAGAASRIRVFFPEFEFCLDNAAMIAGLGYQALKLKKKSI